MNILGYTRPNSKREIVQIDQPEFGPVENPAWSREGHLLNETFSSLQNIARKLGKLPRREPELEPREGSLRLDFNPSATDSSA
jgi:hypothetical protein